jgi:hypothetical protein
LNEQPLPLLGGAATRARRHPRVKGCREINHRVDLIAGAETDPDDFIPVYFFTFRIAPGPFAGASGAGQR